MAKKISLFLVFLFVLFTGCQNNSCKNNTTESNCSQGDPFTLTIEQVLIDYQYMWEFLDENLPNFNLIERVLGFKVDEIREEGGEFLALYNYDYMSVRDFFYFLTEHLDVFISVFHIGVFEEHLTELIFHNDNVIFLFEDVIFDLERSQTVYQYLFPRSDIEPSKIEVRLESLKPTLRIIDDYTAIIDIPTFFMLSPESYELQQLYLSFFEEVSTLGIENLILDISQNTGGNTRHWGEYIVAPNIEEEIFFESLILTRDSQIIIDYIDFWFDIWYNGTLEMRPITNNQFDLKQPEDLDELGLYGFIEKSIQPYHDGTPVFDGNFYVLIDQAGFSATDAFANFIYQTGFATLIGRPTSGAGVGMQPLIFSLPESGLLIRFDINYGVNADGSANQEIGTSPHYFSEGNERPLETALRIIEERRLLDQE